MESHAGNTEGVGAIQTVFWTYHQELIETSDITVEDAGMHHVNMVHDVVTGLYGALHQYQVKTKTPTVVQAPVDHVANVVQNTQQKLSTQLQKMQVMMQAMQMQYDASQHVAHQDYGGRQYYGGR